VNDLERRLRDSLKSVGESYRPAEPLEANARFRSRRRRRVGLYSAGLVLAGMAAAVAFVFLSAEDVGREGNRNRVLPVVGPTADAAVTATVDVGDNPSGVGIGEGYVWIANSGDDTVSKVDPANNKVVQTFAVPGAPDDVLVSDGYVWVATKSGEIVAIDPDTNDIHTFANAFTSDSHLDLAAAGDDGLWVVEEGGSLWRLHLGENPIANDTGAVGADLSDIATYEKAVWTYDRSRGEVLRLDSSGSVVGVTPVGRSESADLGASDGFAWLFLGDEGTLYQIEEESGDIVSRTELGGTFGAVAEESGVMFVMVTEGGPTGTGEGRLYRIDAGSAERIGNPVPLSEVPYDLEAGLGGIWITNNSSDQLTRVGIAPEGDTPVDESPAVAGDVLFYFARAGDIFSYDSNGTQAPVLDSPASETSPTISPDGRSLIVETGRVGSPNAKIVSYDLATGNPPYPIDRGESPAYSPEGRVAWAWIDKRSDRRMISVGTPGTDDRVDFDPDPEWALGPPLIENIAWDAEGNTIYYESSYEGTALYTADVGFEVQEPHATVIQPNEEGAIYLSPAVHEDGTVTVVRLCCGTYPVFDFEVAELGRLDNGEYTKIAGLDDFGLEPSFDVLIEAAGHLEFEAETGWTIGAERSWLAGDGRRLMLIAETGEVDAIDLEGVTHVTVVPGSVE
jgi:YVTN family beta-propeller protein